MEALGESNLRFIGVGNDDDVVVVIGGTCSCIDGKISNGRTTASTTKKKKNFRPSFLCCCIPRFVTMKMHDVSCRREWVKNLTLKRTTFALSVGTFFSVPLEIIWLRKGKKRETDAGRQRRPTADACDSRFLFLSFDGLCQQKSIENSQAPSPVLFTSIPSNSRSFTHQTTQNGHPDLFFPHRYLSLSKRRR